MIEPLTPHERQLLTSVVSHAHEQSWGIACGFLLGFALLVATNFLIFKGGSVVGPHLSLLSVYLPGYTVTFLGSLVGFVYAFVIGYGVGRTAVTIYNRLSARLR